MSNPAQLTAALRRAYDLGQTYWQQADSNYKSEWSKSDATRAKFEQLIVETVASCCVAPTEAAAMAATVPAGWQALLKAAQHVVMLPTEDGYRIFGVHVEALDKAVQALASQAPVAGQPAEPSPAARDVLAERARQLTECGHDYAHDDSHNDGQIADEAGLYLLSGQYPMKPDWCWKHKHPASEKRVPRRMQLVIGAALAIAEIERIDRAAPKGDSNG